ncbi:MAG: hypothetical protein AAF483_18525 [Planctomycetota bacterium]
MTAPYSNEEIKDWAESLRDQVSRISGRKKGGNAGFSAELKGDLLDAIDILVDQASEDIAPDPITEALEKVEKQVHASIKSQEEAFRSSSESILASLAESIIKSSLQEQLEAFVVRSDQSADKASKALGLIEDSWSNQREQFSELCESFQSQEAETDLWQANLTESSQQTNSAIAGLRDELESLRIEQQNLRQADSSDRLLDEIARVNGEAREAEQGLRAQLNEALQENRMLALRQRDLESQILELETLTEKLQATSQSVEAENRSLQATIIEQEKQVDIYRGRCDEAQQSSEEFEAQLAERQFQLEQASERHASANTSLAGLEQQNVELRASLGRLQEENAALLDQQPKSSEQLSLEVRNESLESKNQELERINEELERGNLDLESQLRDLAENTTQGSSASDLGTAIEREDLMQQIENLQQENDRLESAVADTDAAEELARLQSELAEAQQLLESAAENGHSEKLDSDHIDELEQMLSHSQEELEILKNQNSDLAAQLAKQQVLNSSSEAHFACDEENLTWEDRKRLIMQQLADEDDEQEAGHRAEIEQILASTEQALEHKTREIEELREQLQAGGAAEVDAVQQDEAVQEELNRLKQIEAEWEEKLRQAEIDLSAERAKLARERSELEEELTGIRKDKDEGAKNRKWLDHLGLREEAKNG